MNNPDMPDYPAYTDEELAEMEAQLSPEDYEDMDWQFSTFVETNIIIEKQK